MKLIRLRSALLTATLVILSGSFWLYLAPSRIGGSTTYVVTHGVSMEPRFHNGDLALVRPAAQYKVGDIVAYRSPILHELVLHRIVAIHGGRYTFKGDNNHFLDPVHPGRAAVIGRLWLRVAQGGLPLGYLHTPLVAAVLCGGAALLLMTGSGRKRGRRNRRKRSRPAAGSHGAPGMNARRLGHAPGGASLRAFLAAAGAAFVMFLAVTVIAFTQPSTRGATQSLPYTQQANFHYRADAPAGPVYPTGVIRTGDPIFLQLVHRLAVGVDYHLSTAAVSVLHGMEWVSLKLQGPTGWSRSIPLTTPRPFRGQHFRASVSLNLSSLQAMLDEIEKQTGIPPSGYTVTVAAHINQHGLVGGRPLATSFDPQLAFQFEPLQLQVASGASTGTGSVTSSNPAVTTTSGLNPSRRQALRSTFTTANSIGVLGISLGVSALRLLAPLGLVIALVSTVLLVLLVRGQPFGESARIQARYGHMIVPIAAGKDLGWPAIDVSSIRALARLAEVSGQLILHSHGDDSDIYLVNDAGSVYRYQVQLPRVIWSEWAPSTTELAA